MEDSISTDEIIKMWWEADLNYPILPDFEKLKRFVALVAKAEREACALTCEQAGMEGMGTLAAAAAIRAREKV